MEFLFVSSHGSQNRVYNVRAFNQDDAAKKLAATLSGQAGATEEDAVTGTLESDAYNYLASCDIWPVAPGDIQRV